MCRLKRLAHHSAAGENSSGHSSGCGQLYKTPTKEIAKRIIKISSIALDILLITDLRLYRIKLRVFIQQAAGQTTETPRQNRI